MNLKDVDYVRALQSNMRSLFDTAAGKEVMRFLEAACGWYQSVFTPGNPDMTLINDGKRQVIATIKTLLERAPEEIVAMTKARDE